MGKKEFIEAGKIVNTHGVSGDVKIEVWLDSPEFLKKFKRVFLDRKEIKIISSSVHKDFLIAHLEGINDINSAMSLKEKIIEIKRSDAHLPKDKFFYCEIIGFEVYDKDDNYIGILKEVLENPAQPIFCIKGNEEHLVPAVPEFIMSTDFDDEKIVVNLIEGM